MSILKSTNTGKYAKITEEMLKDLGFVSEFNGHQFTYTKCPYTLTSNMYLKMPYPRTLFNETETSKEIKLFFYISKSLDKDNSNKRIYLDTIGKLKEYIDIYNVCAEHVYELTKEAILYTKKLIS